MILQAESADEGTVSVGSNIHVGYLSQNVLEMAEEKSILDEFRDQVHMDVGEARSVLAKFLFYGNTVLQKVKSLSSGEKIRLRLDQLLHHTHTQLILDYATTHF